MNILEKCKIIEDGISKLGLNPTTCRGKNTGEWDFVRGSANIAVGIRQSDKYPNGYFYVVCSMLNFERVPHERRYDLLKVLMEENLKLVEIKFCLSNSDILLVTNRDALGLDKDEVSSSIDNLSYYADVLDDILINKFAR